MAQKLLRFGLCILSGSVLSSATCQTVEASDRTSVSSLRFVGAPASKTKNHIIFETSAKTLLSSSNRRLGKSGLLLTADLGLMHNIGSSHAVGASFYGSADDDGAKIGVRSRYRRWLGKRATFDVTAGLLLLGDANFTSLRFPGYVASASIGMAGRFSIDAHMEVTQVTQITFDRTMNRLTTRNFTETSFYLGASGRGFLGFVIPAAVVAIIAAASNNSTTF